MNEIRRALVEAGAQLPLVAPVEFQSVHLACKLWQEGQTVYLVQLDGTRAVGHWRAEQKELLSDA